MKILIIEDEINLLHTIRDYLEADNHICEMAADYDSAEEKIHLYDYDIILLDITLPGGSGLDLLRDLKKNKPEAAIIIVSAKSATDDKVEGLNIGADDYLSKPFHLSELNSRIKALYRRRKFNGNHIFQFNEISIETNSKEVSINDTKLKLTRKEYDLLMFFISNKNRVLTKEAIAEHLWGDNIDLADNFDFIYTHLNNLRKKIKKAGGNDYFRTLYGIGYKFASS